jgi:hypothetical protein
MLRGRPPDLFSLRAPTLAASSNTSSGGLLPETTPVATASTGGFAGAMLVFSEPLEDCWRRRRRRENWRAFGSHRVQQDSDLADCEAQGSTIGARHWQLVMLIGELARPRFCSEPSSSSRRRTLRRCV